MATTQRYGQGASGERLRIGSETHKERFCRMLLDTFDPYEPAAIDWPQLSGATLERLTGLPFWDVAVATEGHAALRMQTIAEATSDPLIQEALQLNAFEERRHKQVIEGLLRFYGIKTKAEPVYRRPAHATRGYLQTGYGECFDSFFAFGLFKVADTSGFFPPGLVKVFEPIMQEEARHILFFVNWVAYTRACTPLVQRPVFTARCLAAFLKKARSRLELAKRSGSKNSKMTRKGHAALGIKLTPGAFLDLCLQENVRRMAQYDSGLPRPQLVPRLVRMARPFVPGA